MLQTVILLLFSLGSLMAQVQDYFPLVPGSTWVYRSTNGAGPLTLRLGESLELNGKTYHRLDGYKSTTLLIRRTEEGDFNYWDETSRSEAPFLLFDGKEFSSPATPCDQQGRAELRPIDYSGPIGSSQTARQIRYTPGVCADTGLTSETFVPYLGMVHRTQTSFVGERSHDLVYAQIGGITYLNDAGVSFSIAITPLTAERGTRQMAARLVLNNRTGQKLELQFASGQTYDFVIRDEKGEAVYRWSADKLFTQAQRQLLVKSEEVWQEVFPPTNLRSGIYSVEAMLVNSDGKKFSATASINLP